MSRHRIFNYDLPNDEAFWLSKINHKYILAKQRYQDDNNILVPPHGYMSAENSRIILGKQYLDKIDEMISKGYVERIDYPEKNSWNKQSYGFIPLIEPDGYRHVWGKKFDRYYRANIRNLSPEGKIIYYNLHHAKFDLDEELFKKLIYEFAYPKYVEKKNTEIKEESTKKRPKQIIILSPDEYFEDSKDIFNEIKTFNNSTGKELIDFITEDIFGNRIHTIFSSVPAILRQTIKLDGEETGESDLKQSQPSITASVLSSEIGRNSFSDIVENTDLYLYLKDELGLDSRDEAKNYYYSMAYGTLWSPKAKEMFKIFPDTEKFITDLKLQVIKENPNSKKKTKKLRRVRYENGKKITHRKKRHYTNFAFKIQQKESEIFRKVWQELNSYGIRFLPVHDSIIVAKSDMEFAYDIMERSLST